MVTQQERARRFQALHRGPRASAGATAAFRVRKRSHKRG